MRRESRIVGVWLYVSVMVETNVRDSCPVRLDHHRDAFWVSNGEVNSQRWRVQMVTRVEWRLTFECSSRTSDAEVAT